MKAWSVKGLTLVELLVTTALIVGALYGGMTVTTNILGGTKDVNAKLQAKYIALSEYIAFSETFLPGANYAVSGSPPVLIKCLDKKGMSLSTPIFVTTALDANAFSDTCSVHATSVFEVRESVLNSLATVRILTKIKGQTTTYQFQGALSGSF